MQDRAAVCTNRQSGHAPSRRPEKQSSHTPELPALSQPTGASRNESPAACCVCVAYIQFVFFLNVRYNKKWLLVLCCRSPDNVGEFKAWSSYSFHGLQVMKRVFPDIVQLLRAT